MTAASFLKGEKKEMKIRDVISEVKTMRDPNAAAQRLIGWINDVEDEARALIQQAAAPGAYRKTPYEPADQEETLLIPPPYDKAYVFYCIYRQDLQEGQIERANNALASYNAYMDRYAKYRTRENLPAAGPEIGMEGYRL